MKSPKHDPLPPLQFAVLSALVEGQRAGPDVRAWLEERSLGRSGPAFYQLMARLEDLRLVEGWYQEVLIGERRFRERHYKLTAQGGRVHKQSEAFYRGLLSTPLGVRTAIA